MYIPPLNQETDTSVLLRFMRRYSFATLVTAHASFPKATHLPFVIEDSPDAILLSAHMALANDQWKDFSESEVLVIFQEPHAYISPTLYDRKKSVPTWNYIAVHAYGIPHLISEKTAKEKLIEDLIHTYEIDYMDQWKSLPDTFKTGMFKGITAFQIKVSRLEGKFKLSQNKSTAEQQRISNALQQSPHTVEKELGSYMDKD